MRKKLFVDFDNTIVDSTSAIVDIYNEDFKYYKDFRPVEACDVKTYNFKELTLAKEEYINQLWNQPRFFERLRFIYDAKEALQVLKQTYDIYVVTLGYSPNLYQKVLWIKQNLPFVKDVYCVNLKEYKDKSHIDMSGGIFIDDYTRMLETSNADKKIAFGDDYGSEDNWNGERCYNWCEVFNMLENLVTVEEDFKKHNIVFSDSSDLLKFAGIANGFVDYIEIEVRPGYSVNGKSICDMAKTVRNIGYPLACKAILHSDNVTANRLFDSYMDIFSVEKGGEQET